MRAMQNYYNEDCDALRETKGYPIVIGKWKTQFAIVHSTEFPGDEYWHVLHIASGKRVGGRWRTQKAAIKAAESAIAAAIEKIGERRVNRKIRETKREETK